MRAPLTVGIAGLGESGGRLARLFDDLPQARLRSLCDPHPARRLGVHSRFPQALVTGDLDDLVADDELDAIVVTLPPAGSARFVEQALAADKHVLVDKTIALDTHDAESLASAAAARRRLLSVVNELRFHPAVSKLKECLEAGTLGELLYLYANRQRHGVVDDDASALWSLGPDVIGTILYLLDDQPIEVSARGESYVRNGMHDVVFCYMTFATGISAHVHLSWLDPNTVERLTLVGSARMAVFDELAREFQLTLHEKSVATRPVDAPADLVAATAGEIHSLRLPDHDPLRLACEHFVASVRSAGHHGAREPAAVVAVLEALQQSLDADGIPMPVHGTPAPARLATVTPLLLSERPRVPQAG